MKFNDFFGLGITEILMNIISCHGLSILTISKVILTFRSALVPYYSSKDFFIVEKLEGKCESIPERALKQINASPLHAE